MLAKTQSEKTTKDTPKCQVNWRSFAAGKQTSGKLYPGYTYEPLHWLGWRGQESHLQQCFECLWCCLPSVSAFVSQGLLKSSSRVASKSQVKRASMDIFATEKNTEVQLFNREFPLLSPHQLFYICAGVKTNHTTESVSINLKFCNVTEFYCSCFLFISLVENHVWLGHILQRIIQSARSCLCIPWNPGYKTICKRSNHKTSGQLLFMQIYLRRLAGVAETTINYFRSQQVDV